MRRSRGQPARVVGELQFENDHASHGRNETPSGAVSRDTGQMPDELAFLAAVPLFAQLGEDQLRQVASRSTKRAVAAGAVVVTAGERADHLIVVEAGALTAVRETPDGQRLRLGQFEAPCAVDKTAVLDASGHTATWIATTKSQLRLVRRDDLLAMIDDVPAARRHVLLRLATQIRHQQDDLVNRSFGDTTTRVAAWLVRKASQGGSRVVLPGAQEGLGEAIGASRVSVNRALRKLARLGLIRTEPGAVTLLAPELLAQHAEKKHS